MNKTKFHTKTPRRKGNVESTCKYCEFAKQVIPYRREDDDVPISLADACLIRMAELNQGAVVFTTDNDFRVYCRNGRQVIPLMIP